jgi:hypothetical protein
LSKSGLFPSKFLPHCEGNETTHPHLCASLQTDFRKAKEKVMHKKKEGVPEGLYL